MSKLKRALISVSDKSGVAEFARALSALGVQILSTGSTAKLLEKEGVPVTEVSAHTGFPEMLDGRVKTLHPRIHGGILARREVPEHMAAIAQAGIEPIDLIVVNLYPFHATVADPDYVDEAARTLLKTAEEALYQGISRAVAGNHLSDISHAVQSHVERRGYSVVREFTGHGIGRSLHENPQVPNFGRPGMGVQLKARMVFAIEPMVNQGESAIEILHDGCTAVTRDRRLSVHFEHSVAITENGPEILSRL